MGPIPHITHLLGFAESGGSGSITHLTTHRPLELLQRPTSEPFTWIERKDLDSYMHIPYPFLLLNSSYSLVSSHDLKFGRGRTPLSPTEMAKMSSL